MQKHSIGESSIVSKIDTLIGIYADSVENKSPYFQVKALTELKNAVFMSFRAPYDHTLTSRGRMSQQQKLAALTELREQTQKAFNVQVSSIHNTLVRELAIVDLKEHLLGW